MAGCGSTEQVYRGTLSPVDTFLNDKMLALATTVKPLSIILVFVIFQQILISSGPEKSPT